jgi:putative hydrolase of the HAD superfamily
MIKAIVFDFDGLILDTESSWYDVYCEIYKEHGAQFSMDVWARCVGTGDDYFFEHLEKCSHKPVDRAAILEASKKLYATLMQQKGLRPGVEAYLREAKAMGFKIGLASSSSRKWVEGYLKQFDIYHYFECIYTADDVKKVKPDPELYLRAIDGLGVRVSEAVAFEDSPNGARAAKSAGLHCVIVPNPVTAGLTFEEYNLRIDSMADLSLKGVLIQLGLDDKEV